MIYILAIIFVSVSRGRQQRRRVAAERTYELALARAVKKLPCTTYGGDDKQADACYTARSSTSGSVSAVVNEGSHDDDDGGECCAICLCRFCAGDELRTLPCSHAFHVACIDSWLLHRRGCDSKQPPTCPLCKAVPLEVVA